MKQYDLIVIGAGSGLDVATNAANNGWKVAIVEKGPMGGTCLNRGCIPSKMLIHCADVAYGIDQAKKFGIETKGYKVDWEGIINRVNGVVDSDSDAILKYIESMDNLDLYNEEGKFIDKKIIQVGNYSITSPRIVIAAGTRPAIPDIDGINNIDFMTSKEALRQTNQPKHLVILGGGYISCELAHFYGSLGTEITILQRNILLVPREDYELAKKYTDIYKQRFNVYVGITTELIEKENNIIVVHYKDQTGKKRKVTADQLLVATGRVSNSDILNTAEAGIELNEKGYIETDEFMRTNVDGIWAFGDIAGKYFFKHSANQESIYINYNLFNDKHPAPVDYSAMPHAIFGSPQIAGVGQTEEELNKLGIDFKVGRCVFRDTGMGDALLDDHGLVKVLADHEGTILGCHIIGPEASTLIHEPILAMKAGLKVDAISYMIHVHPALSEVIERAFADIGN